MARYIDADALMEDFARFVKRSNNSDFAKEPTWNDAVSIVENAQTADVRENVHAHCEWYIKAHYKNGIEDERPSNGDRIRAMTDEELADWLEPRTCHYGWLDWLKQGVENAEIH